MQAVVKSSIALNGVYWSELTSRRQSAHRTQFQVKLGGDHSRRAKKKQKAKRSTLTFHTGYDAFMMKYSKNFKINLNSVPLFVIDINIHDRGGF